MDFTRDEMKVIRTAIGAMYAKLECKEHKTTATERKMALIDSIDDKLDKMIYEARREQA